MSKITGSAPYFIVSDLERSLDYYCDVLGFTRPRLWGEPPCFAMPSRDGFILMLSQTEASPQPNAVHDGAWDAYFWITDADALFQEFTARGAHVAYEICVQEYDIKEFAIKDPDGHILAFGQPMNAPG